MGITPKQFERMKDRLKGTRTNPGSPDAVPARTGARTAHIILGIDPSLRSTGYGIISTGQPGLQAIAFGTIASPAKWERSRCLLRIATSLKNVLKDFAPTICVVESLFYAQNLQTALIMGEARGASLVSVAEAGLDIYEIAPRKVKQAIVGYGGAQKLAVAKMVQRMLNLEKTPSSDAGDALALALTLAQNLASHSISKPKKI